MQSFFGSIRGQRQVSRAGHEYGKAGHNLFPAFFHNHSRQSTGTQPLLHGLACRGPCKLVQITVAEGSCAADKRYILLVQGKLLLEEFQKRRFLLHFGRGVVEYFADVLLAFGQSRRRCQFPCLFICKRVQQIDIDMEHVVDHPFRKKPLHGVPVQHQSAVLFVGLVVQPYLRRLGAAGYQIPQPFQGCGTFFG